GLDTEPVKRAIRDIPALVLPAVLIMRDATTRILVENKGKPQDAKVIDPSATAPRPQPFAAEEKNYLGYAFLIRPTAAADPRVVAAGDLPRPHWVWSVVSCFWTNYSNVAIAALLVNILALASPLFIIYVYDRVLSLGEIASLISLS